MDSSTEYPKLTRPREVRAWIESREFSPSKVLGQNFLIDENILGIMVDQTGPEPDDGILEIGPGLGILTAPLLEKAGRVVAIEKDKRLASHLAGVFSGRKNLALITADALDVDLIELKREHRLNKLAANLPYSVGSRLLVECFLLEKGFDRLVVTVQLEVGERLAAPVDSTEYGLLSIWAQLNHSVRVVKRVSPSCFHPRPRVTSAIVRLDRTHDRRNRLKNPEKLDALLRHAFSRRRKQIGTILDGFTGGGAAESARSALEATGIEARRRPETISVEEWIALADKLS